MQQLPGSVLDYGLPHWRAVDMEVGNCLKTVSRLGIYASWWLESQQHLLLPFDI